MRPAGFALASSRLSVSGVKDEGERASDYPQNKFFYRQSPVAAIQKTHLFTRLNRNFSSLMLSPLSPFIITPNLYKSFTFIQPNYVLTKGASGVHSPLEKGEISLSGQGLDMETILELLNNSAILNLILVYLVLMLTWLIIIKAFTEKSISLDWINSYPLGNKIRYILTLIFKSWKMNNFLWIYLTLFFMLMACCTNLLISYLVLTSF